MERLILKAVNQPDTLELCEGLTSLGRNPTNDFRLHDPTVSSFHCEILTSGDTVLVRDLNSTNGTFIDGEPVQEAFLRPWQILRLGHVELRLEMERRDEDAVVRIPEARAAAAGSEDSRLLDGRLGCLNHPGVAAVVRCTSCHRAYCADCVKPLGLKGGQKRLFCPSCSSACVPLGTEGAVAPKKRSIIGRLTQTIRIKWR